jgi:hypothetical protein
MVHYVALVTTFFTDGIRSFMNCYTICIKKMGDYVEKLYILHLSYIVVHKVMNKFIILMCVPCVLYSYYPDQQMHNIYIYIYIYIYVNSIYILYVLLHVSVHLLHLQGVLSFYFAKVTKIIKIMKLNQIMCILYNQRYATCTMFFIIISAVHVSGGFSSHHQELIKLYVQPWVLSCFPAVYRW